jgi:hypothetical protein
LEVNWRTEAEGSGENSETGGEQKRGQLRTDLSKRCEQRSDDWRQVGRRRKGKQRVCHELKGEEGSFSFAAKAWAGRRRRC